MSIEWSYLKGLDLAGSFGHANVAGVTSSDARRQARTAEEILHRLGTQPGVVLADEVGMGKTFVALAVAASVIDATWHQKRPVIITVPRGLVSKWHRDWRYFQHSCIPPESQLRNVRTAEARRPLELFRLFDHPADKRPRLIVTSVTAYTASLRDPWIKLAMLRLARSRTRLSAERIKCIAKWAPRLIRQQKEKALTPDLIGRLMSMPLKKWHDLLQRHGARTMQGQTLIPTTLEQHADELEWKPLTSFLHDALLGLGNPKPESIQRMCRAFNDACQEVFGSWRNQIAWKSPLLILDEAHHAKNDGTRLANLFRSSEAAEQLTTPLAGRFDRMLLLTATPFQLNHTELLRVLRCFDAIKWTGRSAPSHSRDMLRDGLDKLHEHLDNNRLAARELERVWGRLTPEIVSRRTGVSLDQSQTEEAVQDWLEKVHASNPMEIDPVERSVVEALGRCERTKKSAEGKIGHWDGLRTWLIRHNRPSLLSDTIKPRRRNLPGAAIRDSEMRGGLTFTRGDALAFLLAARAQGEAAGHGGQLLKFADGLCSSFEAFHHTRKASEGILDHDTPDFTPEDASRDHVASVVPMTWYASKIKRHIPESGDGAGRHPKIQPVVRRVIDLWQKGEKVLVFCFYVQTARALATHIERELDRRIRLMAKQRTGIDDEKQAYATIERVAERIRTENSPFQRAAREIVEGVVDDPQWKEIHHRKTELIGLLMSYVRSVPFLVRILPAGDPRFYAVFRDRHVKTVDRDAACEVLRNALVSPLDGATKSFIDRAKTFMHFVNEQALRSAHEDTNSFEQDEAGNSLKTYLHAIASYSMSPRSEDSGYRTRYRAEKPVRLVYGKTKEETRERVMLAFNSPLFPEILVSSKVLGEGVDLHRFCRHVIHHDLDWNPSVVEQRTGRLDRIRCLAEIDGEPIVIYEPFIAGSADERKYRVVRDRQRWFQIVMGQGYSFDEGMAEDLAWRLPLPEAIGRELIFDLAVG